MKIQWEIKGDDVNNKKYELKSPLFETRKEANLWQMKFTAAHPDDYINYHLVYEDGKSFVTDIGCCVYEVWSGH